MAIVVVLVLLIAVGTGVGVVISGKNKTQGANSGGTALGAPTRTADADAASADAHTAAARASDSASPLAPSSGLPLLGYENSRAAAVPHDLYGDDDPDLDLSSRFNRPGERSSGAGAYVPTVPRKPALLAANPEPVTEAEPFEQPEPEPVVETELVAEPEPVVETELVVEPVLESELVVEPETVLEAEPDLALDPEPEPAVVVEAPVEPDLVLEADLVVESEPVLEVEQGSIAESFGAAADAVPLDVDDSVATSSIEDDVVADVVAASAELAEPAGDTVIIELDESEHDEPVLVLDDGPKALDEVEVSDNDNVLKALIGRVQVTQDDVDAVATELGRREDLDAEGVAEVLADLAEIAAAEAERQDELRLFSEEVPNRPGQLTRFAELGATERRRVIIRVLCLLVARAAEDDAGADADVVADDEVRVRDVWPGEEIDDEEFDLPNRVGLVKT